MGMGKHRSMIVSEELYDTLDSICKDVNKTNRMKKGINTLVQEILWETLDRNEWVRRIARFELTSIDENDNDIAIKDNITNNITHVLLQNDSIFCERCETENCVHVGVCLANKRVALTLKRHNLKTKLKF